MSKLRRDGIPKTLKWAILDRDNYTCRYCGARGVPMEIDHVFPEAKGGPTVAENLVTACEPCNRAKRDRLGFYPLPLNYLDKLNQANEIIAWYKDLHRQLAEREIAQKAVEIEKVMDKELARIEAAFRRRQMVFAAIKAMPHVSFAIVALASVLFLGMIYLVNNGRFPYPPPFVLFPYLLFGLSFLVMFSYKRALDWYCRWPYPRYEMSPAQSEKE